MDCYSPDKIPMYFFEKNSYAEKFFNEVNDYLLKNTEGTYLIRTKTVDSVEKIDIAEDEIKPDDEYDILDNKINVVLNGKTIDFVQSPIIENGTTLVPMRAIFEAMGASVDWDNNTKTVTAIKSNTTISLTLNSNTAKVNEKVINLTVPAKLINGSTMVPLRFISESLGAEVNWDVTTKTVTINS